MTERVPFLAFAPQSRGATGVREYLQEHRQQARGDLLELSESVLLLDERVESIMGKYRHNIDQVEALDVGIRMELLPLRAQRDIWSSLASGAAPDKADAEVLARAFLRVAARSRRVENDAFCVSLARTVLSQASGEEQSEGSQGSTMMADAAFRRRMQRFMLSQVQFPVPHSGTGCAGDVLLEENSFDRVGAIQTRLELNKRHLAAVPDTLRPNKTTPSTRDSTTPLFSEPEERPMLLKEVENRASGLSKQLAQLARSNAAADTDDIATRTFDMLAEVVNDVHTTYAANEQSFQHLCGILRMHSTSDDALACVISALVASNWSSRYAAIFLKTSVLPRIRAAETVIPRTLLQATLLFGSAYADALVDSLLLPLLVGGEHSTVGPAQAEAITRILCNPDTALTDQLDEFIQKSLAGVTANDETSSGTHLLANESALLVFQNVLNAKPILSSLTVDRFVGACEAVLEQPEAERLRGSLKFTTVVFTLITKYPQQCACHVEALEAIVAQLTSIMAKATMRSLEKLKKNK